MVLAIVMDVYTEIRRNAGQSETVWETFETLLLRLWLWRRWIPDKQLAEQVRSMSQYITREQLLEIFPKMPNSQLDGLLRSCCDHGDTEGHRDLDFKESMKMTMAVKLGIDKV